jgi:Flp pilus assembly pilin Flp
MIRAFLTEESGNVNVEWVLITALMVGLGLSVMAVMTTGLGSMSQELRRTITSQ